MNLEELAKEFGPKPGDGSIEIDLSGSEECDPCEMYRDSSEGRSRGVLDRWKDPFDKEKELTASVIVPTTQASGILIGGEKPTTDLVVKDRIRAITKPENIEDWETDIPLRAGSKLVVVVNEEGLAEYMVKFPDGRIDSIDSVVYRPVKKDAHLGGVRE